MRSPAGLLSVLVGLLIISPLSAPAQTPKARVSPQGTCHVVALFARFPDQDPGQTSLPGYAHDLFNPDLPGSFTHFYHEMSSGRLAVKGSVLPSYYTSDRPASGYPTSTQGCFGAFNSKC